MNNHTPLRFDIYVDLPLDQAKNKIQNIEYGECVNYDEQNELDQSKNTPRFGMEFSDPVELNMFILKFCLGDNCVVTPEIETQIYDMQTELYIELDTVQSFS